MAIDIKFDLVGNPEPPTIILATRNGNKLGQLNVDAKSINLKDCLNDASEFSFTLNKYIDNKLAALWDKVVDFKLVYCKEWDMWFEIKVELDEATETVKTVYCTQLGQAELSQIMLYDIHINEEGDPNWDKDSESYKSTILCDGLNPEVSLLHRLLEKAPHYSIKYVDPTIAKIQRTFSFDGTSIYDAFQEIAEEIGCLFVFPSNSGVNGEIQRDIYVYDLEQNCLDCGRRGQFTDVCPNLECQSTNIKYGYGEDTTIFVTSDELASDGIELVTDTDSVKNCFKLEAGDDLMTATIRNCNPNGTDYIWYFSNSIKEDMSDDLVDKLESYDDLYRYYNNDHVSDLDASLLSDYNLIVNKYSVYNKGLQTIIAPITGYSSLMNAYYNVIDLSLYLESGLMPSIEMSETNAEEQASLLTTSSLSPVAVTDIDIVSVATASSAVLAMAKIIVKSTYKVDVDEEVKAELIDNGDTKIWRGRFTIENYSDEEDYAVSDIIEVDVNDDLETFVKQKLNKALNKENTDDYSVTGLFEKDYDDFCEELKKYALRPLDRFHSAGQSCIDIMIDQGVGNDATWSDKNAGSESNLYEKLYVPYYNKLMAIEAEMKVREDEISIISEGLKVNIEECRTVIQDDLNFENYLGKDLWLEFCTYRREDKYSNDNYISDGLDNAELFERALEFIGAAENEIFKSAELQHSISTTLNNLLAIPKFKPLVKSFKVGNWIRVQVDDAIYKLRLLEYEIDYGNFDNIPVEFSDVTKIKNGFTDLESILSQSSSMATSYSSVQKQVQQSEKSSAIVNGWVADGLDATNTMIIGGADNQTQTWDEHGMLFRKYDSITDTYDDEQLKIVNSTMAITDNNWKTVKTAVGAYYYYHPVTKKLTKAYGVIGETIVGKILLGEELGIYNDSGSLSFDKEGFLITNGTNSFRVNPNSEILLAISNSEKDVFYVDSSGKLHITGDGAGLDISANSDITDLYSKITMSEEGILLEVGKLEEDLNTRINQNATDIALEANRATEAEGQLSARINVNAEAITSEVARAKDAESKIIQTADEIRSEVKAVDTKLETDYTTTTQMNAIISTTATDITSTVSAATSKYSATKDGETFNVTMYGYGEPSNVYDASKYQWELYLDQSSGDLYESNGSEWVKITTLDLITDQLSTQIEQTATSITSTVKSRTLHYGTCYTESSIADKIVECIGFVEDEESKELYTGAAISVEFIYENSADSPTLNVNGTGAKPIYAYNDVLTSTSDYNWNANSVVTFVYDGTYWKVSDSGSLYKSSEIKQTVDSISLTVTDDVDESKTASIVLKIGEKEQSGTIDMTGIVSFIDLSEENSKTIIHGGNIITGTITANQIAADAITSDKIKAGAITANKISTNAITTDKIKAEAITADKIALNSITADRIDATDLKVTGANVTGTLTGNTIDACTILGSKFMDDERTAYLTMYTPNQDSSYIRHYAQSYSNTNPVLEMRYNRELIEGSTYGDYWELSPFGVTMLEFSNVNSTAYPSGLWNFSNATVTNLTPVGTWNFSGATVTGLPKQTAVFA